MTMLYGTSYGTSPLALRALPLHKGDTSTNHKSNIRNQTSYIINQTSIVMKKELWQKILNIIITILTAIATTFGVTSCM